MAHGYQPLFRLSKHRIYLGPFAKERGRVLRVCRLSAMVVGDYSGYETSETLLEAPLGPCYVSVLDPSVEHHLSGKYLDRSGQSRGVQPSYVRGHLPHDLKTL